MSKKAYIGVNGVSKNVSNIYVGVNGTSKKVVKGYVGVSGVSKIFFASGPRLIPFTTNQAPTTWNNSGSFATGENDLGTWRISSSAAPSLATYPLPNAFDGNINTATKWSARAGAVTITLELPEGVTICPTKLYTYISNGRTGGYIAGYDPETEEWVDLVAVANGAQDLPVTTDRFFSKFSVPTGIVFLSTQAVNVFEIAITNGTIKDER